MPKSNFNKEIDRAVTDLAKFETHKRMLIVASEAEDMMKKYKSNMIDRWFGEYNAESMKIASRYNSSFRTAKSGRYASFQLSTWFDLNYYKKKPKAEAWISKYGDEFADAVPGTEYVFNLQLDKGIIGLPKDGQRELEDGTHWHNEHFVQRPKGLGEYTQDDENWKNFVKQIEEYYGGKVRKIN